MPLQAADHEAQSAATEATVRTAATLALGSVKRSGDGVELSVIVTNLSGHKFPTGYPSRRAWLHVKVTSAGGEVVFESGRNDAYGRLVGRGDSLLEAATFAPHRDVVNHEDQVQIYESVPVDAAGKPAHRPLDAHHYAKDNRLLPDGFDRQEPLGRVHGADRHRRRRLLRQHGHGDVSRSACARRRDNRSAPSLPGRSALGHRGARREADARGAQALRHDDRGAAPAGGRRRGEGDRTVKRDHRLHPLSRDHHHALVLARFIAAIDLRGALDADVVKLVKERFETEMVPHFEIEEMLLSALLGHGADELVRRTRAEHARITMLVLAAGTGDASSLGELSHLLTEHVRFEERELYPACEELLPANVLDQVANAHAALDSTTLRVKVQRDEVFASAARPSAGSRASTSPLAAKGFRPFFLLAGTFAALILPFGSSRSQGCSARHATSTA